MKTNIFCLITVCFLVLCVSLSCSKTASAPNIGPDPVTPGTTITITSLSVTSGKALSGITINGTNFNTTRELNKVFINGKAATVLNASATQLLVVVPLYAGTGPVTLSVNGSATITGPVFTYIESLVLNSLDKDHGIAGAPIVITGEGFSTTLTNNKIFFNGKAAEVTAATPTQATVKVPQDAGIGKITATVNGQSADGPNFNYYIASTVTRFAGDGESGYLTGPALSARFSSIQGIAMDATGNFYISSNDRISKLSTSGMVTTFIGNGFNPSRDGIGTAAYTYGPGHMAIAKNGTIYFIEKGGYSVRQITPAGIVTTLTSLYLYLNPKFTDPTFSIQNPEGIAVDGNGNLYVTDLVTLTVKKITETAVTTVAGKTFGGVQSDGPGTTAVFGQPTIMTIDQTGNIFVVDKYGSKLRKISPSYEVSTIMSLPFLQCVSADKKGNLYVSTESYVAVINPSGAMSYLAGVTNQFGNANGDQETARFSKITDIVVDDAGSVYVADENVVRKITVK